MGRNCKPPEHKRHPTTIQMSAIERARYGARAKCLGLSLGAYLRALAEAEMSAAGWDDAPTTPHPIGPLPPLPKRVEA